VDSAEAPRDTASSSEEGLAYYEQDPTEVVDTVDYSVENDEVVSPGELTVALETLRRQLDDLREEYGAAGAYVRERTTADVEFIHELREEADNLLQLVRGRTLFGRYADDAAMHRKQANRWRRYSVFVLVAAVCLESWLVASERSPSLLTLTLPALPLALLFTYTSVESQNHRRAEFDRQRIFLRMAAIESYTMTDISSRARKKLGGLLNKFIERHFIEPELDSNDLNAVLAGGLGAWSARLRGRFQRPGRQTRR
jgi:hypothetical protein